MGPKKKTRLERCGKIISVPVFYMFSRENNLIEGLPDSLGIRGPGKKAPGFFFWAPNQNGGLFFGPPCIGMWLPPAARSFDSIFGVLEGFCFGLNFFLWYAGAKSTSTLTLISMM